MIHGMRTDRDLENLSQLQLRRGLLRRFYENQFFHTISLHQIFDELRLNETIEYIEAILQ